MVVSLLVRAALVYGIYLLVKKIWAGFKEPVSYHQNQKDRFRHNQREDIVEADYTVVDEKEIGD